MMTLLMTDRYVSTSIYVASFALSALVTIEHEKEPILVSVPWHISHIYGLHEDFHLLLFIADACTLVIAVCCLLKS
jgi:hypothetical protein